MLKEERIENTLKAEQTRQHVKSGTDLFLAEKGVAFQRGQVKFVPR
jgi:hypothetical protein